MGMYVFDIRNDDRFRLPRYHGRERIDIHRGGSITRVTTESKSYFEEVKEKFRIENVPFSPILSID